MEQDPYANEKQYIMDYFTTFDQHRNQLYTYYKRDSTLIFEGIEIQKSSNISAKLNNLPLQGSFQHRIHCIHCQRPHARTGGVLAFATGELLLAGQPVAIRFTQVFHLMPHLSTFYVLSHIFRLHYA